MKYRHEFYLDGELSERLKALALKPGASKTAIMSDALRAWLDRRGASELDERFKARLDRVSTQLNRMERNEQVIAETVALLARYVLTVTAPPPETDRAARALGQERFKSFLDQVGRRIGGDRSVIDDVLSLVPSEVKQ
jgi:predicted transcriptional regulator